MTPGEASAVAVSISSGSARDFRADEHGVRFAGDADIVENRSAPRRNSSSSSRAAVYRLDLRGRVG